MTGLPQIMSLDGKFMLDFPQTAMWPVHARFSNTNQPLWQFHAKSSMNSHVASSYIGFPKHNQPLCQVPSSFSNHSHLSQNQSAFMACPFFFNNNLSAMMACHCSSNTFQLLGPSQAKKREPGQEGSSTSAAMGNQCVALVRHLLPPVRPMLMDNQDQNNVDNQAQNNVNDQAQVMDLSRHLMDDPTWYSLHCSSPGCQSWIWITRTRQPEWQVCRACGQHWAKSWVDQGGPQKTWDPTW